MDVAPAGLHDDTECPYVGLFAFDEAHARYFFGRDSDAELIAANVLAAGVMILHGPSGVGKSSVMGAAFPKALNRIIPDALIIPFRRWDAGFYSLLLQEAESRRAIAFHGPRHQTADDGCELDVTPYAGLSEDTRASLEESERPRQAQEPGTGAEPTEPGPQGQEPVSGGAPAQTLERLAQRWDEEIGTPCNFVLDQFEQYFTGQDFGNTTEDEQFEADLARIIKRRDICSHVLISIREDALFELNRLRARIPNILARSLKLDYLDRIAAEEAINGPLGVWRKEKGERAGPTGAAPDLVDALIRQVSRPGDTTRNDGTRIETPYLQLALKRLWQEERDKGSCELRSKTLNELRGAGGIAENHFKDMMKGLPENERRLCAHIFDRMVTPSGMKIALAAADLAAMTGEDDELVGDVLEKLAAGRSLIIHKAPSPKEGGAPLFEIFHDVLARPIIDWIAAERERSAQEHRLAEQRRVAEEERRRQQEELERQRAEAEREHLLHQQEVARQQRQIAAEKKQKRIYRRLTYLSASFAVLMLVAAIGVIVAYREAAKQKARVLAVRADLAIDQGDNRIGLLAALAALPEKTMFAGWIRRPVIDESVNALLRALYRPLGRRLDEHSDSISYVGYNGDGSLIVTASDDKTARVWDTRTGECLLELGHDAAVSSAAFSAEGPYLLTASKNGQVHIWNSRTGAPMATWPVGSENETALVSSSPHADKIVTASSASGIVKVWHWNGIAGQAPSEAQGLRDAGGERLVGGITSIAFDPSAKLVVVTSWNKTARIWDAHSGQLLAVLPASSQENPDAHSDAVLFARFSPDSRYVVTASADRKARIWRVPAVCVEVGCPRLTSLLGEDAAGPRPVLAMEGHAGRVTSAAFDRTGKQVITASTDGTVRVWDANTGEMQRVLQGPAKVGGFRAIAGLHPNGNQVAAAFAEASAYLWELPEASGPLPLPMSGPASHITSVAASRDDRRLATAFDRTVRVFELGTDEPPRELAASATVMSVAFGRDSSALAVASGNAAQIWSVPVRAGQASGSMVLLHGLWGHAGLVLSVAFDPPGNRIVTASQDGTARIWDARTGKAEHELRGHKGAVFSAAFSADGSRVVTGSFDGTVRIWNTVTGEQTRDALDWTRGERADAPLDASSPPVLAVAFTGDDRYIAATLLRTPTAARPFRTSIAVWDLANGMVVKRMDGESVNLAEHFVAYSRDDGMRLPDGFALLAQHRDSIRNVVGSGTPKQLYTVSPDGAVRAWQLPPIDAERLIEYASRVTDRLPKELRQLTDKERQDLGLSTRSGRIAWLRQHLSPASALAGE